MSYLRYNQVVLKDQVVYLRSVVDAKDTDLANMERRLDLMKPADAGRAVMEGHQIARQRRLIERLGAELTLLAEENHALRSQYATRAFASSQLEVDLHPPMLKARGASASALGAVASGEEAAKLASAQS